MDVRTVIDALDAIVLSGDDRLDTVIEKIYASDLMSDVLAFGKAESVLLTGLANQQAVISAHMAEFKCVALIRGKTFKDRAESFARDHKIALLATDLDMYEACVRIDAQRHDAAADHDTESPPQTHETIILNNQFLIEGSDFAEAGSVSTEVKSVPYTSDRNPIPMR